jgi:hypothetical protein
VSAAVAASRGELEQLVHDLVERELEQLLGELMRRYRRGLRDQDEAPREVPGRRLAREGVPDNAKVAFATFACV